LATRTRKIAAKPAGPAPANVIERKFKPALCIIGGGDLALWGKSLPERLRLQFAKAGVTDDVAPKAAADYQGPVIFVRGDAVLDEPLVHVLAKRPHLLLTTEEGRPMAAQAQSEQAAKIRAVLDGSAPPPELKLLSRAPSALDADFWDVLKKRETPFAFIADESARSAIEWRMFMGTYKGATDLVTKYLWPVPAFHLVRWLAPRGVTPNMVTSVAAALVFAAFFLFLNGHYFWGLTAAWLMTFLDTVDGKLARTTLTSSKWGDVFDHGIDLIHPPFWYAAWTLGLATVGLGVNTSVFYWLICLILGGYVLQRLVEGAALQWLKITIHIWRPIDTWFRLVTARRNPNLVVMTAGVLVGRPDWGIFAVAGWTIICLVLHAVQLAQAFAAKRNGPLQSWMSRRP
jgi:phosphatidylglycerophosphate synthase